ncbi:MAG: nucleoside monophosphate kinase [bacterium]|nr:nucleoside monophosphate kinase [bacterium]
MKTGKILNLIFFGPQGSGKGTQAKLLARQLGLRHLSSGEALRETAKTNTPLGRYLSRQLSTGILTPIPKLLAVFESYIKKIPKNQGLIFDGFARQITETLVLLRRLKKLGRPIDATVFINVSEKEGIKRLSLRGQCDRCNRLFILNSKVKLGSVCPSCGGKIFQRSDDTPTAIKKRLSLYRKRTLPVINFFRKQGLLVKINGEQGVDAVHEDIVTALKKKKLII